MFYLSRLRLSSLRVSLVSPRFSCLFISSSFRVFLSLRLSSLLISRLFLSLIFSPLSSFHLSL